MLKAVRSSLTRTRLQVMAGFGLKIAAALSGFLLSWLIARFYGASGVGIYAVATTTVILLSNLATWGHDYLVLRGVAAETKVQNFAAARALVLSVGRDALIAASICAGLLLLFHGPLSEMVDNGQSRTMLLCVVPALLGWVGVRTGAWALRGSGNMIVSQFLEGPATIWLSLIVVGALALSQQLPPIWGIGIIYAAAQVTAAIAAWTLMRRHMRSWPSGPLLGMRSLYVAGFPLLVSTFSIAATEWVATLATSASAGPAAAGQLRAALQLISIVAWVALAFDGVLGPQIAAAWRVRDLASIRRIYRKATLGMVVLASPLLLFELFAAEWLMGIFGAEFVGGADALRVLAVGQLLALAGGPVGTILTMTSQGRWIMVYSVTGVIVMVALAALAVPAFGVAGGAAVVAGATLFRRICAGLIVRYAAGIRLSLLRSG